MKSADMIEYEKKQKQEKIKELSGKIFDPEQSYTAEEMEALAQKRIAELNQFHRNEMDEMKAQMMELRKQKAIDELGIMGLGSGLTNLMDLSSNESCESAMNTIRECMYHEKKEEVPENIAFSNAIREAMGI